MKLERMLAIGMASALLGTAPGCAEESIDDERRLDTLSSRELRELCEELQSSWPSADRQIECTDGSNVSFVRPPGVACGQPELSQCPVAAGAVRACAAALVDDPCGASLELPVACAELQQAGCASSVTPELAASCPPAMASEIEAFEGIFELIGHTLSSTACDAEGASLLDGDAERYFVVVATELYGAPLGALQSCADLSACRTTAARIREQAKDISFQPADSSIARPELEHAIMCKAESPGALLSQQVSVGSDVEGACALSLTDTSVARAADGSLRLESRTFAWQKPVDPDGCSYRAGEKQANAPCTALEVREARFVSEL